MAITGRELSGWVSANKVCEDPESGKERIVGSNVIRIWIDDG